MIALREDLRPGRRREARDGGEQRLHLWRLRRGEQVDQNGLPGCDRAGLEGLDAVIPYELDQIVGTVETHAASVEAPIGGANIS